MQLQCLLKPLKITLNDNYNNTNINNNHTPQILYLKTQRRIVQAHTITQRTTDQLNTSLSEWSVWYFVLTTVTCILNFVSGTKDI